MYNNDPKYMNPPEAGLASLLASRGRNGDSMLVHMAPEEVQGLQKLAVAYGSQPVYNPDTGLPEFSFLKKLLPTIIGAILPGVPGLGKFAETIGFGSQALGVGLIVGGATSLIEGDLKKGLMAGLGAYSGANLAQSLQAAAAAPVTPSAEEVVEAAEATDAAKTLVGAGEGAVMNPSVPSDLMGPPDVASGMGGSFTRPSLGGAQFDKAGNLIMSEALSKPTSVSGLPGILEGGRSLFTNPNARGAFMQGLGGGFQSPFAQNLSRQATFMGLVDAFTPEYKMPSGGAEEEGASVYIPGAVNPMYGYGGQYSYFMPGQYYKRTSKGLVPYNPYAMAPGYATGGPVQAPDQDMNKQRALPHQYQPFPYPNQNYPLSTVTQGNYSSSTPQPREVVGGYEVKIDPYTGQERFANGGPVTDDDPTNYPPIGVAPPPVNPYAQPAAQGTNRPPPLSVTTLPSPKPPVGPPPITLPQNEPPPSPFAAQQQRYMDMVNAPPKPPVDTKAVMDYVAELNRRAKSPEFIAFSPYGTTGSTGEDTTKPPPEKPDPDCPAGYTYDRVAGACVPIKDVTNSTTPPTPPKGPPGNTITPPTPPPPPPKKDEPKKDEPKKDEPKKDEPKKDEPKKDEPKQDWKDKAVDYLTDAALNKLLGTIHPSLPIARLIWGALPKTTQNRIKKIFLPQVFDEAGNPAEPQTPEDEAENAKALAELEAAKAKAEAEASKTQQPPTSGGGIGLPGGGIRGRLPIGGDPIAGGGRRGHVSTNPGYIDNGDGTYSDAEGNIYDEDGNLIEEARVAARTGGRIRAMQAGGMTAPRSPMPPPTNPYGAAVGEDYNFGFSGGGAMPTEYLAGGKLLEGEGDGMSDSIPAVIRGKGVQRAALADGEFVVPADVVSHLGNGSTKAGAKKLYAMMDRIREARTGRTRQAPEVKPERYLPA